MRLDKYLADMQIGTRSQVKDYIRKGCISINGEVIRKPEHKIDEKKDAIEYNGKIILYKKYRYYMLHKPAGVVTATQDNIDKTVMDLFGAEAGKDLFPVGRLDKDTEGLLIVTNDGELAHNLLSPKKHVPKTYYVECEGTITSVDIDMLESGVDIGDDKITLPAKAELIDSDSRRYRLKLTIMEGRFHQVKRMIKAINGTVVYLKRISMGQVVLDDKLEKGTYRELTSVEVESLQQR